MENKPQFTIENTRQKDDKKDKNTIPEKIKNTDFIKKYGTNGLKAFLALEQDKKGDGEKALYLTRKYDKELLDKIFAKYAEFDDATDKVERWTQKNLNKTDLVQVNEITQGLKQKGINFLRALADSFDATNPKFVEDVIASLDINREIFKEVLKYLKKNKKKNLLEYFKGIKLDTISGPELANKKKVVEEMKKIYRENYSLFEHLEDGELLLQALFGSLNDKLANPNSKFYILYYNGKVLAFNSFTPQEDGIVEFANFNVDRHHRFSKLGEIMMEESLDKESKNATIIATALPNKKITKTYLEEKGFKKYGEFNLGNIKIWKIRKEKEV